MIVLDDKSLRKMYADDGLNDYQVAKLLHVGRTRLISWRRENNVPSKTNKKGLSSAICIEVVRRLATEETVTEIAKTYGVTRASLARHIKKNGCEVPEYRPRRPEWACSYKLTSLQSEVLLGEMFGDGGIVPTSNGSAYYNCAHSDTQAEFVAWKAAVFAPLTSRHGFSEERRTVSMGTWTCPDLYSWYQAFYPAGSEDKILTSSLASKLTPLALAVWYMGDGSVNRNTGVFHVGLQVKAVPEIAEVLTGIFGLLFTGRRYDREWHIRVQEPEKFFSIVAPLLLPSFRYKVPEAYQALVGNQQPSLGENPLEGSTTRPMPKAFNRAMVESPIAYAMDAEHPSHVG